VKDNIVENQEFPADHSAERTFTDFAELLTIAEKWQDQCDEAETHISRTRFREILVLAFVIPLAIGGTLWISDLASHNNGWIGMIISLVFGIAVYIWSCEIEIRRIQRLKSRDQHALHDIVELLREIVGILAKKQEWAPLERMQFRIRLSRFDIGPSSQPFKD
jgi:uncharacterized membrane protein YcjF (UPF0283 family)